MQRCWDCLLDDNTPSGRAATAAWRYMCDQAGALGTEPERLCATKVVMALLEERPTDPSWFDDRLGVAPTWRAWGPGLLEAVIITS